MQLLFLDLQMCFGLKRKNKCLRIDFLRHKISNEFACI